MRVANVCRPPRLGLWVHRLNARGRVASPLGGRGHPGRRSVPPVAAVTAVVLAAATIATASVSAVVVAAVAIAVVPAVAVATVVGAQIELAGAHASAPFGVI